MNHAENHVFTKLISFKKKKMKTIEWANNMYIQRNIKDKIVNYAQKFERNMNSSQLIQNTNTRAKTVDY